jgi:hypothetical protein
MDKDSQPAIELTPFYLSYFRVARDVQQRSPWLTRSRTLTAQTQSHTW